MSGFEDDTVCCRRVGTQKRAGPSPKKKADIVSVFLKRGSRPPVFRIFVSGKHHSFMIRIHMSEPKNGKISTTSKCCDPNSCLR